ncbi:MAG: DUF72 domain-containing protein [Planctomycetes bacterium]|nr:DUF72 domain-containing protein [Planctomycetota bacterium]
MSSAPAIQVGIAGWSYADWEGIVYESQARRGARDPLLAVGGCVDLVEINSSFYRTPRLSSARSWIQRAAALPHLRFSAKAPSACTHERARIRDEARAFREALAPLHDAGKLEVVVAQYPFFFEPGAAERDAVRELAEALRPWPVVFELRAPGWTSDEERAFLRRESIDLACVDMPGDAHGGAREISGQGSRFYLRLHGRNGAAWFRRGATRDQAYDYLYTTAELEPWLERAKGALSRGKPSTLIANNHFRGQALVNAIQMRALLAGEPQSAPEALLARYPSLRSFARATAEKLATPDLFAGLERDDASSA